MRHVVLGEILGLGNGAKGGFDKPTFSVIQAYKGDLRHVNDPNLSTLGDRERL